MGRPVDLWRGLRVIWNYSPRGGSGYVFHVPAVVVRTVGDLATQVTLDVERTDGAKVRRIVARTNVWVPCEKCRPARRKFSCGCEEVPRG